MYRGKSILGIVPARGGSKGVPRKNIQPLGGKPLIAWTLQAAQDSKYLDRCIVSTDSEEIARVVRELGGEVPFLRPAEWAGDDTPSIDVVKHALSVMPEKYDYIVLLQPTSPLRTGEDIDACVEQCFASTALSCVAVSAADFPQWMFWKEGDETLKPVLPSDGLPLRRQDARHAYTINGAVYVAQIDWLQKSGAFIGAETSGYVMPPERSVDIDSMDDFARCEALLPKSAPKKVEFTRTHDLEVYTKESRYRDAKEIFKLLVSQAMEAGLIAPGKTVADFGCAAGEFLFHVAERSPESQRVGYDVVEPLLEKARANVPDTHFLPGSVTDYDLCEPQSFDASFCTGVLSIFDDCRPSLANMIRWTKPGGRIYVTTLFNPFPFDVWVQYAPADAAADAPREQGYNMFSQAGVSRFLQETKEVESFSFQPWILPFDQAPMPEDYARKWTFRDEHGQKLFTNGLSLLLPMQILEIRVGSAS